MKTRPSKLWKCPTCGRSFAKKNQWHSCLARTVESHFQDKNPQLREIYELLITRLRKFGPLGRFRPAKAAFCEPQGPLVRAGKVLSVMGGPADTPVAAIDYEYNRSRFT